MYYLKSSEYEHLKQEVADLIEAYNLTSWPLDSKTLLQRMGAQLIPYSSMNPEALGLLGDTSKDAFTTIQTDYQKIVFATYYNDEANACRQNQSFAHEAAHIWLELYDDSSRTESMCNFFAAYLLAPVPIMIALKVESPTQVAIYFNLSLEAAFYSFNRMQKRLAFPHKFYDYEILMLKYAGLLEYEELEGGDEIERLEQQKCLANC